MRLRDVFLVAFAVVFCIFGWLQEGGITTWPAFKIHVSDAELQRYVMCKPIIVDLMGDGRPVLIASTSYTSIEMYKTYLARGNLEDMFVSIVPTLQSDMGTRIVAIAAGRLSKESNKNAIVILLDDFRLRRLSPYDFSVMWEVVLTDLAFEAYHASITVIPEQIYKQDEGTVLVASQVMGPNMTELMMFAAFNGGNGEIRWRHVSDAENSIEEVLGGGGDAETERFFQNDTAILKSSTTMDEYRAHEKPWTFFREAVITVLPHHYSHPWDEHLHSHIFFHAKNRKKRSFRAGDRVVVKYKDRIIRMNKEDYGALGERLGMANWSRGSATSANKAHSRPANAVVFHGKNGIEVIHLYTGNVITRVAPLKSKGVFYHDINDDFRIDAIKTQIGPRTQIHSGHGVDLINDCLGTIYEGVPFAENHIFNASICDTEGIFGRLNLIYHFIDGDIREEDAPNAINTLELIGSHNVASKNPRSVTPLVVQLHTTRGRGLFQVERHAVFMIDTGLVTSVDPLRRRVIWRSQTEASFYGLREAQDADVGLAGASAIERRHRAVLFPHLAVYSFYQNEYDFVNDVGRGVSRYFKTDPFIIAVGERYMNLLNARNGRVLRTVSLEYPPVAPVIVKDFNGDGINDIVVVTAEGVYGFVVGTETSSDTITALMMLMVGLLSVLFIAREMGVVYGMEAELLPTNMHDVYRDSHKAMGRATD